MRISDAPALKKIDLVYHTPFLTACVAALTAHGYLCDAENEQLRVTLRDRHKKIDSGSLFSDLQAEKNEALNVLQTRLGPYHFNDLLFRWTTARAVESFTSSIWTFAQELLGKAELMFNQPFHLYCGSTCIQHGPFSYFLVQTAGELHRTADDLHSIVRELKKWSISPRSDVSFEGTLAAHLGFEMDADIGLGDWKLHELLKKTWLQLDLLHEFNAHILRQLHANLKMQGEEPRLRFLLEDFQSLLVSSKAISHLDFGSIERVEGKRLRMLSAMQECKDLSFEFYQLLLSTIRTSRVPSVPHNAWSENESRAVINHLLDRGITIMDSKKALSSLQDYCREHAVSPDQLLEAELHRIHPYFDSESSLFLKKAGGRDRLSQSFHGEKHHIVLKKDTLLQHINQRLLGITLVLLMVLDFCVSCGVKTTPRSDVLDARPAVPYHAEQRDYPKKKQVETTTPISATTAPIP